MSASPGELHNSGSTLYTDDLFTGIKTMETTFAHGMDYIGTVRTDRTAGAFDDTKKHFKGAKRGHYRCPKSDNVATVPVWCTQWQDSKVVSLMHSVPQVEGVIDRNEKHKKKARDGSPYSPLHIIMPSIVSAYNKGKVGSDRMDQMVAAYYKKRRFH